MSLCMSHCIVAYIHTLKKFRRYLYAYLYLGSESSRSYVIKDRLLQDSESHLGCLPVNPLSAREREREREVANGEFLWYVAKNLQFVVLETMAVLVIKLSLWGKAANKNRSSASWRKMVSGLEKTPAAKRVISHQRLLEILSNNKNILFRRN